MAKRHAAHWPDIPKPVVADGFWRTDFSQVPLSSFQRSFVEGASTLPHVAELTQRGVALRDTATINTVGEALAYLKEIPGLTPEESLDTLK